MRRWLRSAPVLALNRMATLTPARWHRGCTWSTGRCQPIRCAGQWSSSMAWASMQRFAHVARHLGSCRWACHGMTTSVAGRSGRPSPGMPTDDSLL